MALALTGQRELTVGETGALTVSGNFSDGSQTEISNNLEWQSSNPSVATVSGKGQVAARNEGVAQISVKHQGAESAAFNLSVKAKAPPQGPTVDDLIKIAHIADQGNYDGAFDSLRKAKAVDPETSSSNRSISKPRVPARQKCAAD